MTSKEALDKAKHILSKNQLLGILAGIAAFILDIFLANSFLRLKSFGKMDVVRPKGLWQNFRYLAGNHPGAAVIVLILAAITGILVKVILDRCGKDVDERGYVICANTPSRPMPREEKEQLFKLCDPKHPEGIIYGVDPESGLLVCLPFVPEDRLHGLTNEMVTGFGPSGTGKTSGHIIQNLYEFMAESRPIMVSDPKGELYKETVAVAKYYGYKIYILNTIVNQGIYSDGVDILKPVREASMEEAKSLVDLIVTIIMENTQNSLPKDFWGPSAENLLRLILLTVTKATAFTKANAGAPENSNKEYRNMSAVFHLLKMDQDKFVDMMEVIVGKGIKKNVDYELLSGSYNIWISNAQAAQVKASLATQLHMFDEESVCRLLSEDEIDLNTIATEKAIIYLECPDGASPYAAALTIFVTMLFYNIEKYVDMQRSGKALEKPFTVVFEEMANIGKIPNITNYLSTCRSRGIPIYMYFQGISQMQDIYGKQNAPHEWETMLDNCSIKLLTGVANTPTAEKFEELCGKMRILDYSQKRRSRNRITKIPTSFDEMNSVAEREVPVYSAAELLHNSFTVDKMLIVPAQHNPLMLNKYYYKDHPLYKIRMVDRQGNVVELTHLMHVPTWRRKSIAKGHDDLTGREYIALEDSLTPAYCPDFEEDDDEEYQIEKPKGKFKEKIENLIFEPEEPKTYMPKTKRVESSHTFKDFLPSTPQPKAPEPYVQEEEIDSYEDTIEETDYSEAQEIWGEVYE